MTKIQPLESRKPVRNEEEDQMPEDHDMKEPQILKELPSEMISQKRKHAWAREVIEEAKRHGVPEGTIRERKNPKSYPSYMDLMSDIVVKEETKKKEYVTSPYPIMRIILNFFLKKLVLPSKHREWVVTHSSTFILRLRKKFKSISSLHRSLLRSETPFPH